MRAIAWRWLVVTALTAGATLTAVGCSSDGDDTPGGGSGGSGAAGGTGGTTGGTGGSSGSGAGATGGSGGSAGSMNTGGSAGSAATGGTGGTSGTGGTVSAGAGGSSGSGAGGAGAGGAGGAPLGGSGGDTGGSSAAGTGGGGMPATLVTPIMRSATSYVLEFGDLFFEVNPMLGARVVDVHLSGDTNFMGGMADNSGSVFWPSPQSWPWPPTGDDSVTAINDKPYTASNDDTSMTFVGMPSSVANLSVTKKYAADLAKQAIIVTYTMIGTGAGAMAAPWEITRFPQAGVTFYPTGSTPVAASGMELPPTTTGAGCTWLTAPGTLPTAHQKMLADGTGGWLAHAEDDWVIVKKFTDTAASAAAPNEAEIEIYLSMDSNYMEVEQQGAYGAVAQGAMVNWTVTWFVRRLPSGVTATAGNQALVDFVQTLVQ